jgi:hypothetical protein
MISSLTTPPKTITVQGKVRTRDGFAMLDDVTIQNL